MIALIDYGAGNLTSVRKGFAAAGAELYTPRLPVDLAGADGIVVPGVGHFSATAALDSEWRAAIRDALERGVKLLRHLPRPAVAVRRQRRGRRRSPVLASSPGAAGACRRR